MSKKPIEPTPLMNSLKEFRIDAGYTQEQLAELLSSKGYPCKVSTLRSYEYGRRTPPPEYILYFSVILRLCIHEAMLLAIFSVEASGNAYMNEFYTILLNKGLWKNDPDGLDKEAQVTSSHLMDFALEHPGERPLSVKDVLPERLSYLTDPPLT